MDVRYELLLNAKHSPEQKYATLAHELAHLYCGHLGSPATTGGRAVVGYQKKWGSLKPSLLHSSCVEGLPPARGTWHDW